MKILKTKIWLVITLFSLSSLHAASMKVFVQLSPLGDFVAEGKVLGSVNNKGSEWEVSGIKIRLKGLKTGIELRDKHMYDYIQADKFPFATLVQAKATSDKSGKGIIDFMGKNHPVDFTFEIINKTQVKAQFSLSAKSLGIESISYKGVGVKDKLDFELVLPYHE